MTDPPSPSQSPSLPPTAAGPSLIGGRYRIDRALAEGGMGAVYRVFDERTSQHVALKRMRRADARQLLGLFEREYRTLASIEHPRIIRAYDYGVDAGEPFYTMELLEGRDLYELAPVPFEQACRYLRDVATCLALLHTRRLLHRDVTPRNVRVTERGQCKLLDFGALTAFGIPERTVGTAPFMPPEALRGAPLDQRADLFSFGALAYWTLTRRNAYPARSVAELSAAWERRPPPPSTYNPSVPKHADALVLSLLKLDPLARPGSMAEVVDRLNALGQLPPEDEATQRALAESYLVNVQFIGRARELERLRAALETPEPGQGCAALVVGSSGVGRTRLLDELVLQAQLRGLRAVQVDAAMHGHAHGTAIAIVHALLDASEAARHEAQAHAALLAQLDRTLAERLGAPAAAPQSQISGDWRARVQEALHGVIAAACAEQRLLLAIDNADDGDEASLGILVGLAKQVAEGALALVLTARSDGPARESAAWRLLAAKSRSIPLSPLSADQTLALARSLFGDAPNLSRFAEWLHERSAGLPLHGLELVRKLHADSVVRYVDGLWILPAERPDAAVPEDLDELLAQRLMALPERAYALAEALAVLQGSFTREQCAALAAAEGGQPYELLDALVHAGVLDDTREGLRFAHRVTREVLRARMTPERKRALHLRCAEHALANAGDGAAARIEAGWHLLQAGESSRGADLLAEVAYDTVGVRFAFADLQVAAPALEAALEVYAREGRSLHERLPLLCSLAQAGYYENREWSVRYGDEALAAISRVAGLDLARKLQPVLGKTLGLLLALLIAFVRFRLARPRRRQLRYGFRDVLVQLMGVVTTQTGCASVALDQPQAARIARVMEPFMHLHERLTPVGIGQFCNALQQIALENQAQALAMWTKLTARFADRRWYPSLPASGRTLYLGGLWFARGVFESFRDGRGALEAASALERLDLKLYRMVASEIRMLYHLNRGELLEAQRYREQVELHAIQIGSASQVELWEPAALLLPYTAIGEAVELRRVAERLRDLAERVPSLALYARLAACARDLARHEQLLLEAGPDAPTGGVEAMIAETGAIVREYAPRSFIGWGALVGYYARGLNLVRRHEEARATCVAALAHLGPDDRPFALLFLGCETELAIAEAGLGRADDGRKRLDDLLAHHAQSDNPLTRGRLHEAYARLSALAQDWPSYRHHIAETRSWYRCTGTPSLIARAEAHATLGRGHSMPPERGAIDTGALQCSIPPESGLRVADSSRPHATEPADDTPEAPTEVLDTREVGPFSSDVTVNLTEANAKRRK